MILLYELFAFERARLNRVVFFGFSNVTGNVAFLRHGGDESFAFLRCCNERKRKKEKLIVVRITRTYERTIFEQIKGIIGQKGKTETGEKLNAFSGSGKQRFQRRIFEKRGTCCNHVLKYRHRLPRSFRLASFSFEFPR